MFDRKTFVGLGVAWKFFRLESDATTLFGWIEHKLIHYSRQLGMRVVWYFILNRNQKVIEAT